MDSTDLIAELEKQLKALGLPTNPHDIIGQLFRFECKLYTESHILIGRILGIDFRPGTLRLQVSNTTVGLFTLIAIYYEGGKWASFIKAYRHGFHEGKFQLL
ncbi:MAG TPA: hypothetical protein VJC12_02325 [Candidatus Paceibacterota bacterium]